MISIFSIFAYTLFENYFYKTKNKKDNLNLTYFYIFFIDAVLLFITEIIKINYITNEPLNITFLYDWRFYLFIVLEISGMYYLNVAYQKNKDNFTIINVGIFSTIFFIPVLYLFVDPILGFKNSINNEYFKQPENIVIYLTTVVILTVIYFYDKIQNKTVKSPTVLIITIILLLMSFYVEIKLLQEYKYSFLIYASFSFAISIIYIIVALRLKERTKIPKKEWIITIKYAIYYYIFGVIYMFALTYISAVMGVFYRRVSQIISGLILDKKNHKIKDYVVIILLILLGLYISFQQ